MRLLAIVLLISFFLIPFSEVKALDACTTQDIDPTSIGQRGKAADCPGETLCYKERCPSSPGGCTATSTDKVYDCYKAAAAGTAPAKKPGQAYGIACSTATGQTVPIGQIGSRANGWDGFMTAIGCVPSQPQALVNALIKYSSFAVGGVAFIIMVLASLQMITAEGNPEAVKKAQEKFYSAIIGLLLVIFSVLLMQVIGVDILGLPGFGKR
jgi:hypothetical protein